MLPEQLDILWTFMAMMFTLFAGFAFGNVIKHCRENEGVNTKLWGGIFGILFLVCFLSSGFRSSPSIQFSFVHFKAF